MLVPRGGGELLGYHASGSMGRCPRLLTWNFAFLFSPFLNGTENSVAWQARFREILLAARAQAPASLRELEKTREASVRPWQGPWAHEGHHGTEQKMSKVGFSAEERASHPRARKSLLWAWVVEAPR